MKVCTAEVLNPPPADPADLPIDICAPCSGTCAGNFAVAVIMVMTLTGTIQEAEEGREEEEHEEQQEQEEIGDGQQLVMAKGQGPRALGQLLTLGGGDDAVLLTGKAVTLVMILCVYPYMFHTSLLCMIPPCTPR